MYYKRANRRRITLEAHYLICEYGRTQCERCAQSPIRKNLKNSVVDRKIIYQKNKEIENLKGSLDNILKDNKILKESN